VDNHTPRSFHYLKYNPKKMLKQEEEYERVERENAILLGKLSDIARSSKRDKLVNYGPGILLDKQMRPRIDTQEPRAMPSGSTLASHSRREELVRIVQENKHILSRIEGVRGYYSREKWGVEEKRDSYLMDQISNFHPELNMPGMRASSTKPWRPSSRPASAQGLSPERSTNSMAGYGGPQRPASSLGVRRRPDSSMGMRGGLKGEASESVLPPRAPKYG